jgi:secreted trypsin-like serine protease
MLFGLSLVWVVAFCPTPSLHAPEFLFENKPQFQDDYYYYVIDDGFIHPDEQKPKEAGRVVLPLASSSASRGECGVPAISPNFNARIVGGEEANRNSWPWICMLEISNGDFTSHKMCGSSVISDKYILTAAHCVFYDGKLVGAKSLMVLCGKHDLTRPEQTEQRREVVRIAVHPGYKPHLHDNDITVLQLSKPLRYTDYVRPVCLPRTLVPDYSMSVVAGWGKLSDGGLTSKKLLQVSLPTVGWKECAAMYSELTKLTKNMLCAGYSVGGKDACHGDSGGPLLWRTNGRWEQQGVVSFGASCAQPQFPGVYTRVVNYRKWISDVTNGAV